MPRRLLGVVLAGGASRRYGSPKALIVAGGETLLQRAYRAVLEVTGEACVSLSPLAPPAVARHAAEVAECVVWDDPELPCGGPLRAVVTALAHAPAIVYLSVDAPHVTPAVLEALPTLDPSAPSATILAPGGALAHHAGYASRALLPLARDACTLKGRRARLSDVYRAPGTALACWHTLTSDPRVLVNVNEPESGEPPAGRCPRPAAKIPPDTPYPRALQALAAGDSLEAARLFTLEHHAHRLAGLATLSAHAARDASLAARGMLAPDPGPA